MRRSAAQAAIDSVTRHAALCGAGREAGEIFGARHPALCSVVRRDRSVRAPGAGADCEAGERLVPVMRRGAAWAAMVAHR